MKKLLSLILAALMLVSCTKDTPAPDTLTKCSASTSCSSI